MRYSRHPPRCRIPPCRTSAVTRHGLGHSVTAAAGSASALILGAFGSRPRAAATTSTQSIFEDRRQTPTGTFDRYSDSRTRAEHRDEQDASYRQSLFNGEGDTRRDTLLHGCHWTATDLDLVVQTCHAALPTSSVTIRGRRHGTLVDFVVAYRALPLTDDPSRTDSLEIGCSSPSLQVSLDIDEEATHLVVEGKHRREVLGTEADLLKVCQRAGGRRSPIWFQRWVALLAGLAVPGTIALAGVLAGVVPVTTLPIALATTASACGGGLGFLVGRRRAGTTIQLLTNGNSRERLRWNRSDMLAAVTLAATLLALVVALAGIAVAHRDAQPARERTLGPGPAARR